MRLFRPLRAGRRCASASRFTIEKSKALRARSRERIIGILAMHPIFFPLLTLTKRFSLRIGDITHCFRVPVSMLQPRHIPGAPLHGAICGRRRRDRTARVPQKNRPDDDLSCRARHVVFRPPLPAREDAACAVKVQGGQSWTLKMREHWRCRSAPSSPRDERKWD